jgi:hypothetical protein
MASAPTRTCPDRRSMSLLDPRNTTRPIFFTLLRLLERPRPGPSSGDMRVCPCSGPNGSSPRGPTFRPDPFDLPGALGSMSLGLRDQLLPHFRHHPAEACHFNGPYLLEGSHRSQPDYHLTLLLHQRYWGSSPDLPVPGHFAAKEPFGLTRATTYPLGDRSYHRPDRR